MFVRMQKYRTFNDEGGDAHIVVNIKLYDDKWELLRKWSQERFWDGDENDIVVQDIVFSYEEHERPEKQLEEVMVQLEVAQHCVMDKYEHLVMVEEFKDVMTYRCLSSE